MKRIAAWHGWCLYWLILISAYVFLASYFIRSAQGHEWFNGMRNPATNEGCCNGVDCKVVENEDWWMEGQAIYVKWFDGRTYSMPASQALPTQDPQGRPAFCVLAGRMRCAFIPTGY